MLKKSKVLRKQNHFRNAFFIGFLALTLLSNDRAQAQEIPARFGLSPDNSQDLLLKTLRDSQKEVVINIYQLSEPHILATISELMMKNIAVTVLIEGQPAPTNQYTTEVKATVATLQKAIAQSPTPSLHKLFVMMKRFNATQKRRFVYDHAKYVVVDQQISLIASENFTATGHPVSGNVGNRGWEVVLDDAAIAHQLLDLFHKDTRTEFGDVADLTPKIFLEAQLQRRVDQPTPPLPTPTRRTVAKIESGSGVVQTAEIITSPNSVPPIQKFLKSAKKSVDLEYMDLPKIWAGNAVPPGTPANNAATSPIVTELIQAAQRGVSVRALLNDNRVFAHAPGKPLSNFVTASFLNNTSKCFSLPLEARIVDIKATQITYIHNKGMLVDHEQVLVSSINGTKNSFLNNREVAVILASSDAAHYYGSSFDWDWNQTPVFQKALEQAPLDFMLPPTPCASLMQTELGSFSLLSVFQ